MHIDPLIDHLDLVPIIAQWHWQEWGTTDIEGDVETRTKKLRTDLRRDRVPIMFVALDGNVPLGTSALSASDMTTHPELTPWLANIYVAPAARGRGIAKALVLYAMQQAMAFGHLRLYLYTHTARGLYEKLGWQEIGEEWYEGHLNTLMQCDITSGSLPVTQ